MKVISRRTLREFWEREAGAEGPLRAWYVEARRAKWWSPSDVKAAYRNASFVANRRVVFNISGNTYRLIVKIHYPKQIVLIRFVGTHAEYDNVDAAKV